MFYWKNFIFLSLIINIVSFIFKIHELVKLFKLCWQLESIHLIPDLKNVANKKIFFIYLKLHFCTFQYHLYYVINSLLTNIRYFSGRLLKSFQIDFNWYHLASWVNITEQWPYRTTCIILYHDAHEETLEDSVTLKAVYDKYVIIFEFFDERE